MEQTIKSMRNNCVLRALEHVSGKPDAEIFAAVRRHGYKDNKGMYTYAWLKAATDLGVRWTRDTECRGKDGYKTLGQFLKLVKDGTFFVIVKGHVLVVHNGLMVDKNYKNRPSLKRKIYAIYRVLNPFERPIGKFVKLIRKNPRKFATGAWRRFQDMKFYLETHENVTRSELLKNTPYRADDYAWDLKRGNIILV